MSVRVCLKMSVGPSCLSALRYVYMSASRCVYCLPHDVCPCLPHDVCTCLPHDVCLCLCLTMFVLVYFTITCLYMSYFVCTRVSMPHDVCTRLLRCLHVSQCLTMSVHVSLTMSGYYNSTSLCLYAARVSLTMSVSAERWCPARPTYTPSPTTLWSTCTVTTLTDWTWTGSSRQTEEVPPETSSASRTF